MANSILFCYVLIFVFCAATSAQRRFFSPFQIRVVQSRPNRVYNGLQLTDRKSSDSCSQYPGATCTFRLLCLVGGGVSVGPCQNSLLSVCCARPQQTPPPYAPRRLPSTKVTQENSLQTTQRADVTAKPPALHVPVVTKPPISNYTFCGLAKPKPQSRIIGGHDAMYGEFPWQAHIKLNKQQCGGVLVNKHYVLTAAHCIYQVRLKDISIQLGVYDIQDQGRQYNPTQIFTVVEKKVHPEFRYQAAHPDRYDVALLKLDRPARFEDSVRPICLPRKGWNFEGWTGIITGWGKTDPGLGNKYGTRLLQKVDVPIITNRKCEVWHKEKGIDITIASEMMCAGYEEGSKDACVGDSGGPLMVPVQGRWVVAGLVSAGFGCAQARQPGIYHRVPQTVDWLLQNISP